MKRGYVQTSRGQIHYAEAGSGRPVLLLHQVARSWKIFAKLANYLAPNYRVVAMDFPGFGGSDPLPEPFTVADLALSCIELMDGLGIQRCCVSGHHTGATVACEMAVLYPERVAAVAPSGYALVSKEESAAVSNIEQLLGRHKTPVVTELSSDGSHYGRLYQRAISLLSQSKESNGDHHLVMLPYEDLPKEDRVFVNDFVMDALNGIDAAVPTLQAIAAYDPLVRLPLVDVPTLIIQSPGRLEPKILQRAGAIQKLIPGSKVANIENGDIFAIHSRAEEFGRILHGFFSTVE